MITKYFSGKKNVDDFTGDKIFLSKAGGVNRFFSGGKAASALPSLSVNTFVYRSGCNGYAKSITGDRGFIVGGTKAGTAQDNIEKIAYTSDTTSLTSAVLHAAGYNMGGMNSATKGYSAGGTSMNSKQDAMTFSTEVVAPLSVNVGNRVVTVGASNATEGWYAGGNFGTPVNYLDAMTFATEVKKTTSATLGAAKQNVSSVNSGTKAYWVGGLGGTESTYLTTVEATTFATSTNATLAAVLSVAKNSAATMNSSTKGYHMYGDIAASPYTSKTIDALTFSGETMAVLGKQAAYSRSYSVGTNSGTAGYASGGMGNATAYEKFTFAGETIATLSATAVYGRLYAVGYQSGGFY